MARVLVTEEIADGGLQLLRDKGHIVDVQLDLSPQDLLDAVVGAHALIIRSATKVTDEVLRAGTDLVVVGRGGDRTRQRRRRGRHQPRRDGGQRAAVERALGRRAHDRASPRAGPQHPPSPCRVARGAVGTRSLGGRRAQRQGARRHRPRPRRQARRATSARVRHAIARLRPVRGARARSPDERRPRHARAPDGRLGLRHDPPPEDTRDGGLARPRAARPGEAGHPHRQHGPRRHHRRGRTGVGGRGGHRRRCRSRCVRRGADDVVAVVRARQRRGHAPLGREHAGGAGQGGRHDRGAGVACPRRRVRAVRRERRARRRRRRQCAPTSRSSSASASCSRS